MADKHYSLSSNTNFRFLVYFNLSVRTVDWRKHSACLVLASFSSSFFFCPLDDVLSFDKSSHTRVNEFFFLDCCHLSGLISFMPLPVFVSGPFFSIIAAHFFPLLFGRLWKIHRWVTLSYFICYLTRLLRIGTVVEHGAGIRPRNQRSPRPPDNRQFLYCIDLSSSRKKVDGGLSPAANSLKEIASLVVTGSFFFILKQVVQCSRRELGSSWEQENFLLKSMAEPQRSSLCRMLKSSRIWYSTTERWVKPLSFWRRRAIDSQARWHAIKVERKWRAERDPIRV